MVITGTDSVLRHDSPTVGAFARQLEFAEADVLKTEYPELKAAEGKILPIEELNMPWVQRTSFKLIDGVGEFELARDFTSNQPYVRAVGEEFVQGVFQYRNGYYFSEKEVAATVHRGAPIERQYIELVNESYKQKLNKLILFGDRRTGIAGLINHWGWLRSYSPYPLNSTSTASQMLATLNSGVNAIKETTEYTHAPDTLLLPPKTYDYLISQARLDNQLEKSVLRYFLENNPSVRNIDSLPELAGAGPNGEDIAIYYSRNPRYFKARITDPMRYRPLVVEPFRVYRPVAFDYNGLIVYRPASVLTLIGV